MPQSRIVSRGLQLPRDERRAEEDGQSQGQEQTAVAAGHRLKREEGQGREQIASFAARADN